MSERNSPKKAPNNTEILLALLSQNKELQKGNNSKLKRDPFIHVYAPMMLCDHTRPVVWNQASDLLNGESEALHGCAVVLMSISVLHHASGR